MQTFYRNWGYLPPLDEEVVAIIDAIIADLIRLLGLRSNELNPINPATLHPRPSLIFLRTGSTQLMLWQRLLVWNSSR
jgi:hypothetical protein